MNTYEEAEAIYGHPLQYALVGFHCNIYVGDTEHMDDRAVRQAAATKWDVPDRAWEYGPIERFNRCPTCEQWSPCDVRKRSAAVTR